MNNKKKYICGLMTAVTVGILLTACDAHIEFPDTTMQPCHILCTDGKVVTLDQCEAQGKSPIGVVFYVNQSGSNEHEGTGYAVYLWDITPEMFADSLGTKQNTSASLTKYDGNSNTFAIYNMRDMGSPLADAVFAIWEYGQSAYIPSVAQMQLLYRQRHLSMRTSKDVEATPSPMNRTSAGTGLPQRSADRKPPRHGSILCRLVPFRKRPRTRHTRHVPSSPSINNPYPIVTI